jgi:high-affinity iron transporter
MRLVRACAAAAVAALCASSAAAAAQVDAASLALVLGRVPVDYAVADRTHDAGAAARLREVVRVARVEAAGVPAAASALDRLAQLLDATKVTLQPWPFVAQVRELSATAAHAVAPAALPPVGAEDQYALVDAALDRAQLAVRAGDRDAAELQLAVATARYQAGPGLRVQGRDPALSERTLAGLALLERLVRGGVPLGETVSNVRNDIELTAQTLGEVTIGRGTIVGDAAVIVFREGLEAVLILAAITASFVGARRRFRRPVLLGGLAGLLATALTWIVAQTIVRSLSTSGLQLQAITGLLAIAVLLLVTNWFFHRVYWSEWIGRFNRRRKMLEAIDRKGFLSGQMVGLVLLGLTSVYREGFETVLFLQSLQVSAGTETTMIGVGIGLAATLAVGVVTFLLQRKLPYKRMLILTGLLIALVLAVMTGTTAHTMQGLGWLPVTGTPFRTPFWATTWLGIFPTWETIAAQAGSLVFVIGSYFLARGLLAARRRSAAAHAARPDSLLAG